MNAKSLSSVRRTLVLITSILVVLLAFRNTITHHLQHFWGASGNFWQHLWDRILEFHGNNHFNLLVYGGTLSAYIVYWVFGGIYTFMDVTGIPAFIRPYKIQPGTNEPVSTRKLVKYIIGVHFNQLIIGTTFSALGYNIVALRGYDTSPQLPTFHWVLFELVLCQLIQEIGFYYSHRLFHHPILYKTFHKIHHEWQSPISITASYSHPLEHVLSNMGPVLVGPLILGCHPATAMLWASLSVFVTVTAHSGYHLPFAMSPEFHDFHHLKFNECFGILGILDHLHGTDHKFRASKCSARHKIFFTLVPPHQLVPDGGKSDKHLR